MYGFKQNEVSVSDVFKFAPPDFQIQMQENCTILCMSNIIRDLACSYVKWKVMDFDRSTQDLGKAKSGRQKREAF